jgi:hypothetical protein
MSGHTPGPWTVAGESGDYFPTLADYSPIPATEKNARLMAAAPDMLNALLDLVALLPDPELDADEVQREYVLAAKAAIAKATGGEA